MNNFFPLKTVNLLVILGSHCDNAMLQVTPQVWTQRQKQIITQAVNQNQIK